MGTYGFMKLGFPLFPDATRLLAPVISTLAVVSIIYGACLALVQTDIKKIIAYSSISHLGFVMLGLISLDLLGIQGAVMQMVMGLIGLQVTDLDISITDKQLVGFILNQAASRSGQSAAASRQDLVNLVQGSAVFLNDAGVDPALASEATAAIAGFLGGPGTLRIQIKPKTPVGMVSAMMTPLTKENLGFAATFTPAAQAAPN